MPDSSGATVLDDLPESIIVEEILVRLPLKDVLRCRAVRQAWRGATSTHKFILDNCRRQPFLPVIYLYRECRCGCYAKENGSVNRRYFVFRDAGAGGPKLWPVLRYVTYNKNFVAVHGACDGLLLVSCKPSYGSGDRGFYICNPTTRQHAHIPQLGHCSSNIIAGFYRHHPSEEYRVLYWVSTGDEHGPPAAYYILSLGSDEPRCIGQPSVLKASVKGLPSSVIHAPVMHSGGLHWDLGQLYDDVVTDTLVLDTATEAFRVMHRPAEMGYWPCLLQMDGALALCSRVDCYIFDVWVMHDYEAEIWFFRRRIHLSGIHESLSLGPMIAVVNDRELLIWLDQLLLHCDIDGKNMGYVESEEERGDPPNFALTSHLFQESIAPFPFPNMQEDGTSDEPPFILQAPFIPLP